MIDVDLIDIANEVVQEVAPALPPAWAPSPAPASAPAPGPVPVFEPSEVDSEAPTTLVPVLRVRATANGRVGLQGETADASTGTVRGPGSVTGTGTRQVQGVCGEPCMRRPDDCHCHAAKERRGMCFGPSMLACMRRCQQGTCIRRVLRAIHRIPTCVGLLTCVGLFTTEPR